MKSNYQSLWALAVKYLKKGINKDFVVHTQGVIRAMELILKKEKEDPDILIPAAILHDVGWARVPRKYQRTQQKADKLRGMELHIEHAPNIIRTILKSLCYPAPRIREIIGIVQAHKFHHPRKLSKKLLIDADQLSDAFREQFCSDVSAYKLTPEQLYRFRMKDNHFYTKVAKDIFLSQMNERRKEMGRR